MNNLQNILKSFRIKDELNSKIWVDNNQMNPKVRERLLDIANEFINYLKVDIVVSDIIMTGSLANYNWSEYSDIDLHILADFNQFPKEQLPLYEDLFKLKKTIFNDKHNIIIFGYEVELYVQDEKESHFSSGVYSVLNDEWVNEPKKEKYEIDSDLIKSKVNQWIKTIDSTIDNLEDESIEVADKIINKLKDKIKKYRTCGLEKGGEYSDENLVFKALRRNGYIQKLFDFQTKNVDKKLSIKEAVLSSPVGDLTYTSKFGQRWGRKHPGVDLAAASGTQVRSPLDGIIIDSEIRKNACGGTLAIQHADGIKTRYCHLKKLNVSKGDNVKKGDVIGLSGGGKDDIGKGRSTGPHLHFELYINGKLTDPEKHLNKNILIDPTIEDKKTDLDNLQTKIDLAKKSTFMEGLKKIAISGDVYQNLKKPGQKIPYDKDVEFIQTALQFLGFSLQRWGVDGLFGSETERAVKSFKEKYGLGDDGVLDSKSLKYLFIILLTKDFSDEDLSKIQKKSDFSNINIGSDKEFYEQILKGIGAPITDGNLKFLYAWRQAEGAKATNNPFNTTQKMSKDTGSSNYNKVGVKNYSTPQIGIEATVKTLLNGYYPCIVNGLRDDIGAEKISQCKDLKTWGTGDLVAKVLNSGKLNPPQIYT